MLFIGDRGFQILVLAACLIFPVIGLIIRWKWNISVAKGKEIERLIVLASEESARAEFETSFGYSAPLIANGFQCAVCYSPTTTRCARCKAIRYCSGKCQIIHWRQGHKEQCYPPTEGDQDFETGSEYKRVNIQDHSEALGSNSDSDEGQSIKSRPLLSNIAHSNDTSKEDDFDEDKQSKTSFESLVTSDSGFESTKSSELCDDFHNNQSTLSEAVKSVSAIDIDKATSGVTGSDLTRPLSPKFARLVHSVDKFGKSGQPNQLKHGDKDEEGQAAAINYSSSSNKHEGPVTDPCISDSSFWKSALDSSNMMLSDSCDASGTSNVDEVENTMLSDTESLLSSSSYLTGSSQSYANDSGAVKLSDMSLDAHAVASTVNKSTEREVFSAKNMVDFSDFRTSPLVHGDDSILKNSKINGSRNEKSSQLVNDSGSSTSYAKKSKDIEHFLSGSADVCLPLNISRLAVSKESTEVNCTQRSGSLVSKQITSSFPKSTNDVKTSAKEVVTKVGGSNLSKPHYLSIVSEIVEGIFSYELFVKLYHWNKEELRPSGLINCGNSCYANVVLQCLTFTPPLTSYFLQGLHSKSCLKKEWCFACEFESLILKEKEGRSPLSPVSIIFQLRNIGIQLGNGREEDAHEFLRCTIEVMQTAFLKEAGLSGSESWEEETTLMGLTFGGYLLSKIKCTRCRGKSERQERMMDLTVEIDGDVGTLDQALRRFTRSEILDGDNKYQCSSCKSYVRAKKKLKIQEAPNVLTIVLKRFQSGKYGKLNKSVQFPEVLNMAPFVSGTSDKSPIYMLYGVIVHLDVMNSSFSGHYVCYVKNVQNKWFKLDDSTVTAVETEKVLGVGAYMLFYSRCSPRAPKLIRNRIITQDSKAKSTPSAKDGKNPPLMEKTASRSSRSRFFHPLHPSYPSPNINSFYRKYHQLQRILSEDLSSDDSSLFSFNSDEGSCSTTDSTLGSTSADDFPDYNTYGRHFSDFDFSSSSSASSSPMYSIHSPLANSDQCVPTCPDRTGMQFQPSDRRDGKDGSSKVEDSSGDGRPAFLQSDTSRKCRNIVSKSSFRQTESDSLGFKRLNDVNLCISTRSSTEKSTV